MIKTGSCFTTISAVNPRSSLADKKYITNIALKNIFTYAQKGRGGVI
jgi:hypothetical protein